MERVRWRRPAAALIAVAMSVPAAVSLTGGTAPAAADPGSARGRSARIFDVGAAKVSLTPRSLRGIYLGGYGIGPMHPATGVLRPIYARALAVRDDRGRQVVVTSLDVQGHFLAYRQGPFGFADMATRLHRQLGIPARNLLFQTTHTHNGPDDLGVWGGVPRSYLRFVARRTERAAVRRETPSTLRWASLRLPGFQSTFARTGDADEPGTEGDQRQFPVDRTLRVLQAVGARSGRVVATLVDFASHATVYGPLGKVSPDWPGATATYLEHHQQGMPRRVRYGWPGSVAVVVEGDLGHTWPGGIPRFKAPRRTPSRQHDDNYPADAYGDAIARAAIHALARRAHPVTGRVGGTHTPIDVANDNPVLLAALANPAGGLSAYRSVTPPYGAGDVVRTQVASVRIGRLLFAGAPGEEYPSIGAALGASVRRAVVLPVSLADDQLGYLGTAKDYAEAQECSTSDEGFFTISPTFGEQVLQAQQSDARALGFRVRAAGITAPDAPGVSAVCGTSQL